ncbi:dolichyl pyrophosphate Man9GlcNAc2 alpha-1,3-glucosyltransferase [Nephila pilipes]|uniref:Alpha-1,3-glucosyltransferase n=1 Tax=Nephila pilipes TaxID=299642 RepID=A0A8X6TU22_NEPPI|nr:dolichyl pyrophosphate Man9GlcNAc2 alpha-1,3-glucosyltransferase [Nephila pilipes]
MYNSVSLGFTLWAIVFLIRGHDLIGAAFFTLALHYKQMSLYYALPFFCYLLGTCLKPPWFKSTHKFLNLSCVVIIGTCICWLPFLRSFEDTTAVMERLFPFSRGLYEDKVANIWYISSVIIKWKSIFSTPTLVKMSTLLTILAVLPSSIQLLKNPSLHKFRLSLVNVSLAFFLFSFQVHEKSILLPAMPVLLLLEDYPLTSVWFAYMSTFSLVPLLAKDGLMIPFIALSGIFLLGALRAYEDLLLSFKNSAKYASLAFCISISGSLLLVIGMFNVKQPARYPHLHVLLNCIYSGIHFVGFLLYFNYLQFKEIPYNLYSKKIKYN